MAKVLITGGSGLVGSRISELLLDEGHEVLALSRSKKGKHNGVVFYNWDINKGTIDDEALQAADHIIHLAGAGIADKKWTEERKKEIYNSRVKSSRLLFDKIKEGNHVIASMACASAVGYYGDRGNEVLKEDAVPGDGFLTDVCLLWEKEAEQFRKELNIPTAILRIGIVMSTKGGALPKLSLPSKFGTGGHLGNGKQYYPWIHIDDLSKLFIYSIVNRLNDVYNACSPNPETNKEIGKQVTKVLGRPYFPIPAPAFALKLAMGEMADMLLNSQRTSSEKIEAEGFNFEFPNLRPALEDIFKRKV